MSTPGADANAGSSGAERATASAGSGPAAFAATAAASFLDLQARIVAAFESFEPSKRFEHKRWSRPEGHHLKGGGEMRTMRGDVFEKVGVNFSHVWGQLEPKFRGQIPGAAESDGAFVACGISLVAHMYNPYVPAVHMNTRFLATSKAWFGGGADLTPTFPFEEDTATFHGALRAACDSYRPDAYAEYKAWCDRYFFLPHRKEPRGVGGIFFDELASGDTNKDFAFVRAVGEAFVTAYPTIVARRKDLPFDDAARDKLFYKRGRYVEFNLVYDRGTLFGLQTGGRAESILMSLPPLARWEYGHAPAPGSPEAALGEWLRPRDWLGEA
jgi:coproporphyrinogen III oxidase